MSAKAPRISLGNVLLLLPAAISFSVAWGSDFLWLEALLFAVVLAVGGVLGKRFGWNSKPPGILHLPRQWSRRPLFVCAIPALSSIALRMALLPWVPIPHPVVPDEYSHMFLAKTFLLGRLANPAHPLWEHFETLHILSQPTFSSMYMAGQACFLALGKVLFGDLFWGVVISTALFCAALTWFLRAFVPPGWALFGGLLAAVRIGGASYWNNSYWGGSAGALGGALLFGAYARLRRRRSVGNALVFGLALVLLANTRPYEGAVLGAALCARLAYDVLRPREVEWSRAVACVAAIVAVLGCAAWGMTRHWQAVTGKPLAMPYMVNQQTYGWPMTLPWVKIPHVQYRHPEFVLYREYELGEHKMITVPTQIPFGVLVKYAFSWRFYFGFVLTVAFLFTSRILRNPRMRPVWVASGITLLAVAMEQSGYPHYLSPVAPAIFLFIVQGLRYVAQIRGASSGPVIVRAVLPLAFVLLVTRAGALSPASQPSDAMNFFSWCCTDARRNDRQPVIDRLNAMPGEHLVFVKYDVKVYSTLEWVYNEPDIDRAKIVWARDMGEEKNADLLRYYPKRSVWRVVLHGDGGDPRKLDSISTSGQP
ncbi:MAG: hypothetical protein ABL967_09925 [Bryobacteraceae bacterium]